MANLNMRRLQNKKDSLGMLSMIGFRESGRQDSNLRPSAPKEPAPMKAIIDIFSVHFLKNNWHDLTFHEYFKLLSEAKLSLINFPKPIWTGYDNFLIDIYLKGMLQFFMDNQNWNSPTEIFCNSLKFFACY